MRRALKSTAFTFLLIVPHASAQPAVSIRCKATHEVNCEGAACRTKESEEGDDIYVGFELSTVSGRGNLCTYTYCRDFVLVPLAGDSLDEALRKLSGFTLSDSRGSTLDDLERPAIDYQLSVSEDRGRFVLGNLVSGGFVGWAGTCTAVKIDVAVNDGTDKTLMPIAHSLSRMGSRGATAWSLAAEMP